MKKVTVERIPFREYVLSECVRQWKDCQEADGYGSWESQTADQQKVYFEDMYQHLWPDRFDLDEVDLPKVPEKNVWEIMNQK